MAKPFAALRAAYKPKIDRLGLDFGLSTLLVTNKDSLFGRGLIANLTRIDKQVVGIARHRSRLGGKPRDSRRYRNLITRVRGMLKTRIDAALNRIVEVNAPAELAVERLDFRFPSLSRRMDRLLTNCGCAGFRAKLADLQDKHGIPATEENAAYTSQECSLYHYVDARNRKSQTNFACLTCGSAKHADMDAPRTVTERRSVGLGAKWVTKGAILALLVRRHCERWRWLQAAAAGPRLTNPYFKEWVDVARNALAVQGLASCGQKQ